MNEKRDPTLLTFGVRPSLRCFARVDGDDSLGCGAPAVWQRLARWWFETRFYCDAHRAASDTPVAGELAVRRVHLTADVYFAATDIRAPQAQAEAVARLEGAVRAAGGLVDVQRAISTVGRYPAPAPLTVAIGAGRDTE